MDRWEKGTSTFTKIITTILCLKTGNVAFYKTVLIFSEKKLFIPYAISVSKLYENDNYVTYTGIVNRECERFKLNELTVDNFRVNGWKRLRNLVLYIIKTWSGFKTNVAGSSQWMWKDHEFKTQCSKNSR